MSLTFNPLDKSSAITLSNGDKTAASNGTISNYAVARVAGVLTTVKEYAEFTVDALSGSAYSWSCGLFNSGHTLDTSSLDGNGVGFYEDGSCWTPMGEIFKGPSLSVADIVGVATDEANDAIYFRVNGGIWNNSGTANPVTVTGRVDTASFGSPMWAWAALANGDRATVNFGATPFAYAPPSGFIGRAAAVAAGPALRSPLRPLLHNLLR